MKTQDSILSNQSIESTESKKRNYEMKTTLIKTAVAVWAVGFVLGVWAEGPVVSDVAVRQRWPWSRLVDIDYVLSGATQKVDVSVSG